MSLDFLFQRRPKLQAIILRKPYVTLNISRKYVDSLFGFGRLRLFDKDGLSTTYYVKDGSSLVSILNTTKLGKIPGFHPPWLSKDGNLVFPYDKSGYYGINEDTASEVTIIKHEGLRVTSILNVNADENTYEVFVFGIFNDKETFIRMLYDFSNNMHPPINSEISVWNLNQSVTKMSELGQYTSGNDVVLLDKSIYPDNIGKIVLHHVPPLIDIISISDSYSLGITKDHDLIQFTQTKYDVILKNVLAATYFDEKLFVILEDGLLYKINDAWMSKINPEKELILRLNTKRRIHFGKNGVLLAYTYKK